jgi:hypothetical protein
VVGLMRSRVPFSESVTVPESGFRVLGSAPHPTSVADVGESTVAMKTIVNPAGVRIAGATKRIPSVSVVRNTAGTSGGPQVSLTEPENAQATSAGISRSKRYGQRDGGVGVLVAVRVSVGLLVGGDVALAVLVGVRVGSGVGGVTPQP